MHLSTYTGRKFLRISIEKVISKGAFNLPTGGDEPTTAGGSLLIRDLGDPMNANTYNLPAAGWKGLGNPAGSKGFKYKGAGSVSDPCKVVLIKTKIVKAVCKGTGVTLTPPVTPPPAEVAVNLSVGTGTSFCAVFGGTERFQQDPHWRDLIPFHEYFHGDDGAGLGAAHQTGWTALVAKLIQQSGSPPVE